MAKKQSFADKGKKTGTSDFKCAKVIFSVKSEKTNAWKFIEKKALAFKQYFIQKI